MLFRPKDRKYTAEDVQKKADGYAMMYIKNFKEAIEKSFNEVKRSVIDFSGRIDDFANTLSDYFDLKNGKFYELQNKLNEEHEGFLEDVDEKINGKADRTEIPDISGKADKETTLAGYGITDSYTKNEVEEVVEDMMRSFADVVVSMKADSDLSNVSDEVFKAKADAAGVGGSGEAVSSVNEKTGDVVLNASDVGAYTIDECNSAISGCVDTNIGILRTEISQDLGTKINDNTGEIGLIRGDITNLIMDFNDLYENKEDKPTVYMWSTAGITNFILENKQEAVFTADMVVMVFVMPETIDDLYYSNFCFTSGEEATTLTYSSTPIIWVGDDCDADGAFIPEPNTKYEVSVKRLGEDIVARVGAY